MVTRGAPILFTNILISVVIVITIITNIIIIIISITILLSFIIVIISVNIITIISILNTVEGAPILFTNLLISAFIVIVIMISALIIAITIVIFLIMHRADGHSRCPHLVCQHCVQNLLLINTLPCNLNIQDR